MLDFPNSGFLEGGNYTKIDIWNEDEGIHGVLGGYIVTFINIVTPSKCNSIRGLLAFKQLEVQLF